MSQPNGTVAGVQDTLANAKDSVASIYPDRWISHHANEFQATHSTVSSIQNSNTVQSLSSGPVAQNVKDQAAKTQNEFQNIASSRVTPAQPTATGQPLTHYHSMFYNILSWQNPRASSIAFVSVITTILAARYLNFLHYFFKTGFMVLASTAALEVAGKTLFNNGLASRFRPRRYYTIPREALERSLEDVEQFMNFFCIEVQRIVFAENVPYTLAASMAALLSWGLIKIVPLWGLCMIATFALFLSPLVYVKNQQVIDDVIERVSGIVNQQASQLRDLTAHHTNKATASVKTYAGEYTNMAQSYMARSSGSPLGPKKEEHTLRPSAVAGTTDPSHLPSPPTTEPKVASELGHVPVEHSQEPSAIPS